jgi:hypothetical protein
MCKLCSEAVEQAVSNGIPRQDAMKWLWENTPFPVGDPTSEQLEALKSLKP